MPGANDERVMLVEPNIALTSCRREYLFEVVKLWRHSMQEALDVEGSHPIDAVTEHMDGYFGDRSLSQIDIAMDTSTSTIAGFMVQTGSEIEHLYLRATYQGRGLGKALIALARQRSPDLLELYTFARNTRARQFYEHVGFKIIKRGRADPEFNPWATEPAQLDDLRYQWRAQDSGRAH